MSISAFGVPRSIVVPFLLVALAASSGWAQMDTQCTSLSFFNGVAKKVKYRRSVAGSNLWDFAGLNGNDVDWAHAQAAETWNELSDGRAFIQESYTGTGLDDLPMDYASCQAQGIDFSMLRFRNACSDQKGRVEPRCSGTQFVMTVSRYDVNCSPVNYSLSPTPTSSQWDLGQILTHEFGHILGLQHTSQSTPRVAASLTPTSQGTTRGRDPYWWDQRCVYQQALPTRDMPIRYVAQTAGAFGSPVSANLVATQAAYGNKPTPSDVDWLVFNDSSSGGRTQQLAGGGYYTVDNFPLIAPRAVRWAEYDGLGVQRILHLSRDEDPQYAWNGKHWVQMRRSNNNYAAEELRRCVSDGPIFLSCQADDRVYTGLATVTAWDNYNNRTVVAWVDQRRDDSASDRQILMSVGFTAANVLARPDSLGVRSSVSPGIACNAFSGSGTYDCIVAYVDVADLAHNVRVRRFFNYAGSTKYTPTLEPEIQSIGTTTASSLAAWYNTSSGKYHVAVKSPSGVLRVWSSSTAVTGTWTNSQLDTNVMTGPTAVSYNNGNNKIMYLRSP